MCKLLPDAAIKGTRSEGEALAHVPQKYVSLDFSVQSCICMEASQGEGPGTSLLHPQRPETRLTEHGRADVYADPVVPFLCEMISTQPGATAVRSSHQKLIQSQLS